MPSAYPRVPHLLPGRGTADDVVATGPMAAGIVSRPALVEEKLDGASVMLWMEGGAIRCATRAGVDGRDRAGQLGPLRAWAAERYEALARLLVPGRVMYGEWLLLQHTVAYDALPDLLIVLDLADRDDFMPPDERDELAQAASLSTPPVLFRGSPGSLAELERLIGRSAFGSDLAEGVIVRPLDGGPPRLAKLVRRGFVPIGDEAWARARPRNRVADRSGARRPIPR